MACSRLRSAAITQNPGVYGAPGVVYVLAALGDGWRNVPLRWGRLAQRAPRAAGRGFYHWVVADEEFELGTDGPKVILVGVDDTVTSLRAGAYATGLARRQGARLVCVYVEQLTTLYSGASGAAVIAMQEEALRAQADDLRKRFEEAAGQLNVPTTFIATYGDPYNEIKRVADEVHADAVIVGASTKAGHRLIGSLAVRLVRAGRWPVTVVP